MEWKDFLNPRSMLTPGIAGSVVMLIANTLWVEFSMPQKWTALALSFLLIIPILVQFAASLIENVIYFIFNGLIVFALAVNTNFAGRKIQEISSRPEPTTVTQQFSKAIKNSLAAKDNSQLTNQLGENGMKLALAAESTVTIETHGTSDNAKSEEHKEKEKKKKPKNNRDDREFFEKWF